MLLGETSLSVKPANFPALKIHQKCSTGKCTTLTLSHSLSVPPVTGCLFTDHFVCPSLNFAVFPCVFGKKREQTHATSRHPAMAWQLP